MLRSYVCVRSEGISDEIHILKARLCALILTFKNLAVQEQIVKNKATVNAQKLCKRTSSSGCALTHGVGFGVARFDNLGIARAFERGTSSKRTPHAFLYVFIYHLLNHTWQWEIPEKLNTLRWCI